MKPYNMTRYLLIAAALAFTACTVPAAVSRGGYVPPYSPPPPSGTPTSAQHAQVQPSVTVAATIIAPAAVHLIDADKLISDFESAAVVNDMLASTFPAAFFPEANADFRGRAEGLRLAAAMVRLLIPATP